MFVIVDFIGYGLITLIHL